MQKQTGHSPLKKGLKLAFFSALSTLLLTTGVFFSYARVGEAAINEQMQFQARLLTSGGSLVADGDYHVRFRIYTGGDGNLGGGDETLEWTETHSTGNLISVTNGYVSAQLGSVTAFGTDVDWNSGTLWLSMEIGGTGGSPVWDGEMDPFIRLSSTPYAFNAGQLEGRDADQFAQLDPGASAQTVNSANTAINVNQTGAGGLITLQSGGTTYFEVDNSGALQLGAYDCSGNANGGALTADASGNITCTDDDGGAGGSGVTTVGLIDSQTKSSNGAVISGTSIYLQTADASNPGLLSIGAQAISGVKTFEDGVRVGVASTTDGSLTFLNAANTFTATLNAANQTTGNVTISFPDTGATTTDTVCLLTTGNCVGAGGGGAIGGSGTNGTIALFTPDGNNIGDSVITQSSGDITVGGNLTLAATESLRIIGGNTASRPGSPAEGQVYFDTDTDSLLTYANGRWQSDRGEYTIVAANDSTQAEKDAADYVADGTSDEDEINSALTAAAGGKVLLLAGTYVADATILIPNNTTLAGVGPGTVIELADIDATDNLIENSDTTTGTGVVVRDLKLDGRNDLNTAGVQRAISLDGLGSATRQGGSVTNVVIENIRDNGIRVGDSWNVLVSGNTVEDADFGIIVSGATSAENNRITNNTVIDDRGTAISVFTENNIVADNVVENATDYGFWIETANNSTVTGNVINGTGSDGIYINYAEYATFSGNAINNAGRNGIQIDSINNVVSDNIITNPATTGIYLPFNSDNIVSGNRIHNSGGATVNDGIWIVSADNNIITDNIITDTSCTTDCYAIDITDSFSDNNYLSGNLFESTGADPATINDLGTNTIYANQLDGEITNTATNLDIRAPSSGSVEISSAVEVLQGSLSVGQASTTDGTIVFYDGSSANTVTVNTENLTNSVTYQFEDAAAGTYQICTTSGNCSGVAGNTLQQAYDAGNVILTTDARDVAITLANTTTDPNFLVDIATGSTGRFAIQNNGVDVIRVDANGFDLIDVDSADFSGATVTFDANEIVDAEVSDTLTASNFVGTGSLTNAVDLATAEVNGELGDANVSDTITVGSSGSVDDNALSGNVALLNAIQSFTAVNTFGAGLQVGTASTNNLIDDASNGAGSATLYIGNQAILKSGDIGSTVQAYNANTTILGSDIDLSSAEVTGTLPATRGGTGQSATAVGDLLVGGGSNTWTTLGIGSNNECLVSDGTTASWGSCSSGGSGFTDITVAGNTGASQAIAEGQTFNVLGDGTVLTSNASATRNVTLSVVADSIGNSQLEFDTGQSLTTTSTPTFLGLTVNSGATSIASSTIDIGNQSTDVTTIDGVLNLRGSSGFNQEGSILLGRVDGTARDSYINYYNDSTVGGSYVQVAVHNGTLGNTNDVLTLYGDGDATLLGDFTVTGANLIIGTTNLSEADLDALDDGVISNGELQNSSVGFGGVSVALGASDATPAFDLTDASSLPIDGGTSGTLPRSRGGTGTTSYTTNGVVYANASALVSTGAGTTGQCLVATTGGAPSWGTCAGTGSGSTLQAAYGNGNTITTTDNRNILFTLANTTTDSDFIVDIATSSTSVVEFQNNGVADFRVDSSGVDLIDVDVADFSGATVTFDAGEIAEGEIAQNSLDDSEIQDNSLSADSLADGSVQTGEIQDGTIAEVDLDISNTQSSGWLLSSDGSNGFTWVDPNGVGSDTFASIEVNGVPQSTNAPTLNFNGTDFFLSESPADDFAISLQAERIEDIVGAMVTGNTETGVTVSYQDGDGTFDFVVDNLQDLAGTLDVASGGTGATTSQAAINALSQLTTNGDLLYFNGTNSTRLARGADGQCLTSNTATIVWGSCSGGSGITGSGTANQVAYFDGTSTITSGSGFTYDGADLTVDGTTFTVDGSADAVGIGDSTPDARLDVEDTVTTNEDIVRVTGSATGSSGFAGTAQYIELVAAPSAASTGNFRGQKIYVTGGETNNESSSIYGQQIEVSTNEGNQIGILIERANYSSSATSDLSVSRGIWVGSTYVPNANPTLATDVGVQIGEPTEGSNNTALYLSNSSNFFSTPTGTYALYSDIAQDSYLAGDLGIGDSSPDGKLEVRQTAAADILNLYDNTTNVFSVQDGGLVRVGSGGTAGLATTNGDLYIQDSLEIDGSVDLGDGAADSISFNGEVDTDIIPDADDTYDLGSSTRRWQDVFIGPATLNIGTDGDDAQISYDTTNDVLNVNRQGQFGTATNAQLTLNNSSTGQSSILFATGAVQQWQLGNQGTGSNDFFLWDSAAGNAVFNVGDNNGILDIGNTARQIRTNYSSYTFNNSSVDADLIVNSDTVPNALFVEGSTGNVGIGTGTPAAWADLDVSGNAQITGDAVVGNARAAANGYYNFGTTTGSTGYGIRDNAGTIEVKNSGGSWNSIGAGLGGSGAANQVAYFSGASTLTSSANLFFNGSSLGVGTSSPDREAQIEGNDGAAPISLRVSNAATSGDAEISFEEAGQGDNFLITYDGGNNELEFSSPVSGTTNLLVIERDGSGVGIGNNAPNFNLDVTGTGRFTGTLRVGSTLTLDDVSGASRITSTSDGGYAIFVDSDNNGADTNRAIEVRSNTGSISGGTVSFRVLQNGNSDQAGVVTVNGTGNNTFAGQLRVTSTQDVGLNQNGSIVIGSGSGLNIGLDNNEISARNNSAASSLNLNITGGGVTIGLAGSGTTTIRNSAQIGSSTTDGVLAIYDVDDAVSDQIQFFNGSTRVGEIGTEDGTWLRINQETAKNVYTPRYFRADAGLYVDSTSFGINGSGRLLSGSLSGTYSNSINFSNTINTFGVNNSTSGTISLFGGSAGSEGGEVRLYASNSYDTTLDYWLVDAYQDDFRIFNSDGVSGIGFELRTELARPYLPGLNTTSSGNTIRYDANNQLLKFTSSQRYKNTIVTLSDEDNVDDIYNLRPVIYTPNNLETNSCVRCSGFIAEEVYQVFPELVSFNTEGQIEAVDYERIISRAVAALIDQNETDQQIEADILAIQNQLANNTFANLNVSGLAAINDLEVTGSLTVTGAATLASLNVQGDVAVDGNLAVSGTTEVQDIVVNGKIITAGDVPTVANGSVLGALDATAVDGNDTAGTLSITIDATSTPVDGELIAVTFDTPFDAVPRIALTPLNADALDLPVYIEKTTDGFKLITNTTPSAGTTYEFDYIVIQ